MGVGRVLGRCQGTLSRCRVGGVISVYITNTCSGRRKTANTANTLPGRRNTPRDLLSVGTLSRCRVGGTLANTQVLGGDVVVRAGGSSPGFSYQGTLSRCSRV